MNLIELTQKLVSFESTSCYSNVAVTDFVSGYLEEIGFDLERLAYQDSQGVTKSCVVAKKGSGTGGLACFAHTDVVPADPWYVETPGPFEATLKGDKLYGRGCCDMKGSLACMLAAAATVQTEALRQPLYIVCTADEEVGYGGAKVVASQSQIYREMVAGGTRGIIGEPTMLEVVHAHKGTFGFRATSTGTAAHSSLGKGVNANLNMIPFLVGMKKIHDATNVDPAWKNEEFTPPTVTWNIGINDHTHAVNITPPQSVCTVYYRPMPGMDGMQLMEEARQLADENGLEFKVEATNLPLYVDPQSKFVQEMLQLAGHQKSKTVAYGTDGSVFDEIREKVVFGPGDIAKAHTHDEWISLEQLELGQRAFRQLTEHFCC